LPEAINRNSKKEKKQNNLMSPHTTNLNPTIQFPIELN
jgi:hypothetical protein